MSDVKAVKRKRKRPSYDDQFRSSAVLMLQSQGYPEVKGALSHVARHLKVPDMTLRRWFHGIQNPPPNQVVDEKRADLRTLFVNEIYAIMGMLPDARGDATYQQLVTSMGIFFDKVRLLDGLPTEIVQLMPALISEIDKAGYSASDIFGAMLAKFKAVNEAKRDE